MATAYDIRPATGGLKLELSAAIYTLMMRIEDYRAYRRTVAELSDLSDHALADLGLTRASICATAHAAVYGSDA